MDNLIQLAELIKTRNQTETQITALIDRPAQIGHIGEYIASRIFDIKLDESASRKGIDGYFNQGPLDGCSVNIKWYAKQEGMLDITPKSLPDFYLVLSGPKSTAVSSRGKVRPWKIVAVYLFDAQELVNSLRQRGLKIGIATSVRQTYWTEDEIYPNQRNMQLILSEEQKKMLSLFD